MTKRPRTELQSDLTPISDMCAAFDVTPRTLRFYEAKELLSPVRVGTRRLFTRRDRARLTLILRGKRFGFSLEEIRQTLDLYDRTGSDAAQRQRACEIARERLAIMEAQRAELDVAIAELKTELAASEARFPVTHRAAE
ncbi:MerR family DNA-binding transcriptional regulator [Tabrizicola sp.]|uniref:MerR family transcriptional regulator n=1 Tax=Tabrizicola sp. TaxID=2005166 RepID=UPI0026339A92|nr:MerR family DNA-binding transcriptional regulator [Tabrizicola sp.]MDM7933354.1 MerR family DNA-binding transcriptional regulator [Tabrizicola sp.]